MLTLCDMLNEGMQCCDRCPFGFLDIDMGHPCFEDESEARRFLVNLNQQCVSMLELL